jgi:hypothetical protein
MAADVERVVIAASGLSAADAAAILGVHPGSIPRMIRNGVLAKSEHWQRNGLRREDVKQVALER